MKISIDTIYAESTPKGTGAISVIRMSGPDTVEILGRISSHSRWKPHEQHLCSIVDQDGSHIDHAMCVFHPHPRSYTGEDLAEISCHGNPIIVQKILDAIRNTGLARTAQRGEFTRRAFLNNKIDLIQAEAVGALIGAGSACGYEMAKHLIQGDLTDRLSRMSDAITDVLSQIEASFIMEDTEFSPEAVSGDLSGLICEIRELLASSRSADSLAGGIVTTIAGLPNAGKSSLFNTILGYPRAIVHEEEGTTRDTIREHLIIGELDFIFHDTAGIRETPSGPERLGVERTMDTLTSSDLVLYVVDARFGLNFHERKWLSLGKKTIVVMNKIDLVDREAFSQEETAFPVVRVSAKFGTGIEELFDAMKQAFPDTLPAVFLDRHVYLLGKTLTGLEKCTESLASGMTPDVITIDLRQALSSIRELMGEDVTPDVLDTVFTSFCIGK
ncbi:MAG: tRNA uridine-5-carboxymethylaminomethyl(34) synthesis GTPase MnmE [Desulfomonilia bacterium]